MEKTISTIKEVLRLNALTPKNSVEGMVTKAIAKDENNVRIECVSKSGQKWLLKYSIVHLSPKTQFTGIRAKLNLRNEANFYRLSNNIKKTHIVIPQLLNSSLPEADESWIIIEKLLQEDFYFFPKNHSFLPTPYPTFFIESIIAGIKEFQNLPIQKETFIVQTIESTRAWLQNLDGAFTNQLADKKAEVLKTFDKFKSIWPDNLGYLSHHDLQAAPLGYQRNTKKLALLDFEKVQITHHAFDYTGVVQNPTWIDWNNKFETALFNQYNNTNFKALFYLSCMLKTLANLNNFKTGRLDHVFLNILGKEGLDKSKVIFTPLWENTVLRYLDKLK